MGLPGVDINQLRGLRKQLHDEATIVRRIEAHLDEHDGYLALSGGKDSVAVLHLALKVEPNLPVCFFDGGLEYPETYTYLADLADAWDFDLHTIQTRIPTLQLLAAHGSWDHRAPATAGLPELGSVVVDEPASVAHSRFGAGELWGVRAEESRGRAAAYANALKAETARHVDCGCANVRGEHGGLIRRKDGTTAYGPVWNWKTSEIWAYLERHRIPINPVYDKLRRMGAPEHLLRLSYMIDGGRLEEGRAVYLRRGWPDLFERLRQALPRLNEYV